jgi:hypothetical protein
VKTILNILFAIIDSVSKFNFLEQAVKPFPEPCPIRKAAILKIVVDNTKNCDAK